MQLISQDLGGLVEPSTQREYGFNQVRWTKALSQNWPAQLNSAFG